MPIFKVDGKLLYFVHIPKCAGTSITEYLEKRFGPPGFQDRAYFKKPAQSPWNRTSPQHINRDALYRLFPKDFFDLSVAIVRHPVQRAASIYRFQKYTQKTIPPYVSFGMWLKFLELKFHNPYAYDNHIRPQIDFAPTDTRFFRLEDGLGDFTSFIDKTFGASDVAIPIEHKKEAKKRIKIKPHHVKIISRIYAADFETFDYK